MKKTPFFTVIKSFACRKTFYLKLKLIKTNQRRKPMSKNEFVYIDAYSRQNAIDDGILVDLMQSALVRLVKQSGYRYAVAMTKTAFKRYVELDLLSNTYGQDLTGRLWDILWMLRLKLRANKDSSTVLFTFISLPNKAEVEAKEQKAKFQEINPKLLKMEQVDEDGEFIEDETEDDLPECFKLCQLKAVCGPDDNGEPCITIMLPNED